MLDDSSADDQSMLVGRLRVPSVRSVKVHVRSFGLAGPPRPTWDALNNSSEVHGEFENTGKVRRGPNDDCADVITNYKLSHLFIQVNR